MAKSFFTFKQFEVLQSNDVMKVGTDAVLLGAWSPFPDFLDNILDIGAGTGVISLMLAQRFPDAQIDAVELQPLAFELCVENFENSPWGDRLFCYHASFLEFASEFEPESYDLIVSNPPYHTEDYISENLHKQISRSEQSLPFEDLFVGANKLLTPNGLFSVIIPYLAFEQVSEIAQKVGLYLHFITFVKGTPTANIKRVLCSFSKMPIEEIQKSDLVLEYERHQRTEAYHELTKDFYI
jgi:tRNA1Val (adenine37-N6)-methyltransferase